jgi:hypothetical protein
MSEKFAGVKNRTCSHCGGTGTLYDNVKTGKQMCLLRKQADVSFRELSKRTGLSVGLLCDLEKGRRNWTDERVNKYLTLL